METGHDRDLQKGHGDCGHQVVFYCHRVIANPSQGAQRSPQPPYSTSMKARSLPCSGRLEPQHLLAAIEQGARRVVVVGCPKGRCRYIDGNQRAQKRVRFVQGLIEQIGLGAERIIWIEGPLEYEGDMESLARELGILNSTG